MDAGGYVGTLGGLLTGSSLLALFVIMLLKEIGIPVPIPADLLIIGAGIQAALGQYTLLELAVALEIAVFVGCSIQFLAVRGVGRRVVYRLGRCIGLSAGQLDRLTARLDRRGPIAVFTGLNLPGIRAGMIIAAGLAGMRYPAFAPAMVAGSTVYYGWHVALGYVAGPAATSLLSSVNLPIVPVLVALAVVGLVGLLVLRRRRGRAADGTERAGLPAFQTWTEAACPACLALTAVKVPRRPPKPKLIQP